MALPLAGNDFHLDRNLSWRDADTECQFVLSQPSLDPDLWQEYVAGAYRSYRQHDIECALDPEALRTGKDTVMFFAALDTTGQMLAGARAVGPLRSPKEAHALAEWTGQPGQQEVRTMIADRLPFGILEIKTAWKVDDPARNRSLTEILARIGFHMTALLDVQFFMATSATFLLDKWRTSGGVVAPIPATPYPDERFRTRLIWWDRRTFAEHATPDQASKIHVETTQLLHAFYRQPRVANVQASHA